MPANPSVAAMHEHFTALIEEHQIVHYQTRSTTRAWSLREAEEIHTPPVKTWKSYITALHEIGHLLGRHQLSQHVMVRERWAWRWARQHALVWAPRMERYAEKVVVRGPGSFYRRQMAAAILRGRDRRGRANPYR